MRRSPSGGNKRGSDTSEQPSDEHGRPGWQLHLVAGRHALGRSASGSAGASLRTAGKPDRLTDHHVHRHNGRTGTGAILSATLKHEGILASISGLRLVLEIGQTDLRQSPMLRAFRDLRVADDAVGVDTNHTRLA